MVDGDGIFGEGVVLMVFDVKGSLCPIFSVVKLCIGIILVFQNIIHGGW